MGWLRDDALDEGGMMGPGLTWRIVVVSWVYKMPKAFGSGKQGITYNVKSVWRYAGLRQGLYIIF